MNYYATDHRAPWYVPGGEDPEIAIPFLTVIPVAMVATFTPIAIATGSLLFYGFMALSLVVLWRWITAICRYVVKIPDGPGSESWRCNDAVRAIQGDYRRNPDLREVIEPVLIASYDLARRCRTQALRERERAVAELVTDNNTSAGAVSNADLSELQTILKIRREMRRDGLL